MARKRPNTQVSAVPRESEFGGLLRWIRPISLFMLGLMIVWSLLQPLDSTSVFDGSALPQNLGYFLLAIGVSLDIVTGQQPNRISRIESWVLIVTSLWMLLVTLHAATMSNPRTGWNGFWHLISVFALYFSMRNLLSGCQLRSQTMLILLGGATALAGLAVYQVTIDFPRTRAEYLADPEKVIAQIGIDAPAGSTIRQRLENRLNSPEPYATFSLANSLAVLLCGGLVMALGALGFKLLRISHDASGGPQPSAKISPRSRQSVSEPLRPSGWLVSVLPIVVILLLVGLVTLLTRSRIAILTVPICLGLIAWGTYRQFGEELIDNLTPTTRRRLKQLLAGLVATTVAGGIWLGVKDPLVFTEATKSLSYRLDYWIATVSMIKDHPLLGVGLGNFQTFYPKYMLASASETIADPHNWMLDLASTCSVPVALISVVGIFRILVRKPLAPVPVAPTHKPIDNSLPLVLGALIGGPVILLGLTAFGLEVSLAIVIFITMLIGATLAYCVRTVIEPYIYQTTLGPASMAVAMLLCLLVSGSWQANGLVVPLVCCLAICREDAQPSFSTRTAMLPLMISSLTLLAFFWQSWSPVLQSGLEANRAFASKNPQLAMIENARRIDPYNSQWDRYRAKSLVDQAIESSQQSTFESASQTAFQAINDWSVREPNSFLTGQFAGDRMLQLADRANQLGLSPVPWQQRAVAFYGNAVRSRPTSVQLRIQLAYCYFAVGETAMIENEIAEAIRISDNTPHEDQKLANQLVWIPGAPTELSAEIEPYCRAELVVAWIRRQLNP